MIFSVISCSGIKWDPQFYSIDKYNLVLKNEQGKTVSLKSDSSDRFTCLKEEKILELIEILRNSYYYGPSKTLPPAVQNSTPVKPPIKKLK